jgi:hypothetical protein
MTGILVPSRTLLYVLLAAGIVACSSPAERRLEWNLRTTVRQYEQTGRHDPKWDAPAKEALTFYARWRSGASNQSEDLARQMARRCQEALVAGCPDPLVLYVHGRFVINQTGHTKTEIATAHRQIAARLKGSQYYGLRKFSGFLRAGEHLYALQPPPKLDITEMMNDAATQLSLALEESDAPYVELDQAARSCLQAFGRMEINHDWGWAKLQRVLRKKWGANYADELLRGDAKVD